LICFESGVPPTTIVHSAVAMKGQHHTIETWLSEPAVRGTIQLQDEHMFIKLPRALA
jgi:hypothetical protein